MKKLLLSLVVVAALASCSKENNRHNKGLSISMNNTTISQTKTTIAGAVVAFAKGDIIGLFEVQNNGVSAKQWTLTTSTWTTATPMFWKDNTTGTHSFYAFHPYTDASDHESVAMPNLDAQVGDVASLSAKDFLCATPQEDVTYGTNTATPGSIDLKFNHSSALIQLNIKAHSDADGATFTDFTLTKEGIANTAICNLKSGEVTINTTAATTVTVTPATTATQTLNKTTANTYYVVANKGTGNNIGFAITFTKDGASYNAAGTLVVKEGLAELVAGSKYSFDVTVSLNSISISKAEISDWTVVDGNEEVEAK